MRKKCKRTHKPISHLQICRNQRTTTKTSFSQMFITNRISFLGQAGGNFRNRNKNKIKNNKNKKKNSNEQQDCGHWFGVEKEEEAEEACSRQTKRPLDTGSSPIVHLLHSFPFSKYKNAIIQEFLYRFFKIYFYVLFLCIFSSSCSF